eukprot:3447998-Prymnesium_polylepis.1
MALHVSRALLQRIFEISCGCCAENVAAEFHSDKLYERLFTSTYVAESDRNQDFEADPQLEIRAF